MERQKPLILAVDDEPDMLETFRSILSKKHTIITAASGNEALKVLKDNAVSLILLDIKMPKMNGIETLKKIKEIEPGLDVIMITASKDISSAVEAMKLGAFDYLTKPFEVKELFVVIEKALEKMALVKENLFLKEAIKEKNSFCDLIGKAPVMKKLFESIEQVAVTDSTILINGESGTGKELVAAAIHKKSRRQDQPFIAVNCAAIPENLLESELFGHERGSFTGALERKLGKFELADGGTLFLDEIGCMPSPMQAKLLRVLEGKTIERLGGEKGIPINVRIISATNIDFAKAIEEGKFRQDLYYRLNVIPINLPPLRERKEDIPLLAKTFLERFTKELNKKITGFTEEALLAMEDYNWPGNVREMKNLVERVVVLSKNKLIIEEELFLTTQAEGIALVSLKKALEEHEKHLIKKALRDSDNNFSKAARILGLPRSSLNSRITSLEIS